MTTPTGIHHVTAIASEPQTNVDFYAGLLGLRLVKKTVNFDDPSAYHLYYGDGLGSPGSIVTFFYWPGWGSKGKVGSGQMARISFSAAVSSLAWWQTRLSTAGVASEQTSRFGETVLRFLDPDGIPMEIVGVPRDDRRGWNGGSVPAEHALRGLHTAELCVADAMPTERVVTALMGYRLVRQEGNRARYEASPGGSGRTIDIVVEDAARGISGVGTIHHIAWRIPDDRAQLAMQAALSAAGLGVSDVRDRNYFRSIYYREPNGILFEIATDTPGFSVDEAPDELGRALKLPPQFERARSQIESRLPRLDPPKSYPPKISTSTISPH